MANAFKELTDNPDAKALDHAEWLGLLLDRGRGVVHPPERPRRQHIKHMLNEKGSTKLPCAIPLVHTRIDIAQPRPGLVDWTTAVGSKSGSRIWRPGLPLITHPEITGKRSKVELDQ